MRSSFTAGGCAILMALLLFAPRNAAAQPPHPDPFDRAGDAPALALGISSDQVRRLDLELEDDLRALDAFAGKRKVNGLSERLERRGVWTFYGRLGVLNFQNHLDPEERAGSMRFSLRRTGPRLTGRIYFGIHRKF